MRCSASARKHLKPPVRSRIPDAEHAARVPAAGERDDAPLQAPVLDAAAVRRSASRARGRRRERRRDQPRQVGRVVREVGVHLDHVAGAGGQRVGEAGRVGAARGPPCPGGAAPDGSSPRAVGQLARPVGRVVVDDEHRCASGTAARNAPHDGLEVLGLVVRRQDHPDGAVHRGPRRLNGRRWPPRPTPRSPPPSTSSATSTSSTARCPTASSPTAPRPRPCATPSVSIMALTREGKVTTVPGIGKTLEEKLQALDETGDIPCGGQAAREVPGRADLDHAPAELRRQAGEAALRRARHRLAGVAARGGRGGARSASSAGFGAKVEENLLRVLAEQRGRRRAGAARSCSRARSRCRADRRRAARPPGRATASRSPAPCAAWATRPRTSTSSPPPTTRPR